ncbi:MAG: NAD(P)/FAD-dependent oxidoreductase [Ignavibacteria bacterium]|nr:NAD(P)/FAD-dependent oxidoreductase [Ignavibacteria bacterium]
MHDFEITIIGAGVIGLAIAARVSRNCSRILVVEKNEKYGMETSSRNSEVIHAGIYYPHNSLKARFCVEGNNELYSLGYAHNIPFRKISKIIVANSENEIPSLENIFQNGIANGIELRLLDKESTKKLEPNVNAVASIFSPTTGIISAHGLMDYFFHTAKNNGTIVKHNCCVTEISPKSNGYSIILREKNLHSEVTSEKIINAAGLFSDDIASLAGMDIDKEQYRQAFCKGSYFSVVPHKAKILSRLVYPIPNNESLGVHAVLDLGGNLKFGPDVEFLEEKKINYSVDENKRYAFASAIQRMFPSITVEDLSPDMSGIRPKLQKKGDAMKDFIIVNEKEKGFNGFINLIGIESPGLTASPAIARYVEELLNQ